ncbi:MAG: Xaa-Pro peptidase family protein [Ideonella sp.]
MGDRRFKSEPTAFDAVEFDARVEQLRRSMRAAGVEVALFDEIESMTWLAGYGNSENRWRCVGIPLNAEPFFLIRALDAGACRERTWIDDIHVFRDWEDPLPVLAVALAQRGLESARIGLDFGSYGMSVERFHRLGKTLPAACLVDLGDIVWQLRLRKSPAELELLRRAATIADRAMERAAASCVPGATQRDASAAASAAFYEFGADAGLPGPVSTGSGWDFLHRHPTDAPFVAGDVIHIELTPRVRGYGARLMRCVVIGTPSPALHDAAVRLRDLQDSQIDAMRPGAYAADVDAILRQGVLQDGLRPSFDNITGYTLGLYATAGPRTSDFTRCFHPFANWQLEPDMVFHMYASAQGVSWSETVLVTENGPERLTQLPRTLFINPISVP